jgi:predicted ATP-grasp superfamily ATP-dependent carboligase
VAIRVLVTDVEERGTLAVCRGLARAGYAVTGVASVRPAAGHWSRSVSRRYTLPDPRLDAASFVDLLVEIVGVGDHGVLVPGVEPALVAISEQRDRFEPHVRLGLPPHEVVLRCLDKGAVLDAAREAGLGPPESRLCADADAAAAAAAELGYPVVVKPARSFVETARRVLTATFADGERALREFADAVAAPVLVQRRERGGVVQCDGVFAGGRLLGVCTTRYVRTWPPHAGSVSLSVTVAPPAGLVERVERLLGLLGWEGIFDLELVVRGDGSLATIDFNPRPYGSLGLPLAAGVNLPAIWCDWLLGGAPSPVVGRPGVRFRWEEAEAMNLVAAVRRGDLRTALDVLVPRRGTTHAFGQLADPAPLLARAIGLARKRL